MSALITTDLHLTSAARDAYRWKLFPFLHQCIADHAVNYLFLLGDLTEAKDFHSARLVNMMVDALVTLYKGSGLKYIYIVRGNHDGIDPEWPYFRFLAQFPFIRFITTPFMDNFYGRNVLMLPHTRDAVRDWETADLYDADVIFMHATVTGAVSETGYTLDSGIPAGLFRRAPRADIYSGDVHVPQRVGRIEYVGTPYQVRFTSQVHRTRVILLENFRTPRDLHFETLWRLIIEVVPEHGEVHFPHGIRAGDQVKIRLHLAPHEYIDFQRYKKNAMEACKKGGWELCGLELKRTPVKIKLRTPNANTQANARTPKQIYENFCTQQKVDKELAEVGLQFIG